MTLAFTNNGDGYDVKWNVNGKKQVEIGAVRKDATGNWISETAQGEVLAEDRATLHGPKSFSYFPTRLKAAMALLNAVNPEGWKYGH